MSGQKHPFCCIEEFEEYAKKYLPRIVADYYNGGSCGEDALRNNVDSYQRLRIRPRCLIDASHQDLKTMVLGQEVNIPIGIAPTAMQKMAHPDGEIGNARAIGSAGGIYILSTLSTTSIEDVANEAPDTIKWFQLYIYKDRAMIKKMVARAERAGFKALVLTVDANVFGYRYKDEKNGFTLPPHLTLANITTTYKTSRGDSSRSGSGLKNYIDSMFDSSITWEDVKWLKSITNLPIVVKGILTPEDAEIAIKSGVDAIMISNHGGRQLDTVPSAIEALPEIAAVVGDRIEIYVDGGIRYGTDIFKALALGAKMVFIGRPALWGLAHSGESGVKRVLFILLKELKITLGLAGCRKIADIKKSMVVHESYYAKL